MVKNLTHEEFLDKLLKNNTSYKEGKFEVIGTYKSHKDKILVNTKYGICNISTNSLLSDINPSIRSAVNKTEYALQVIKETHGDKYLYNKFTFIDAKHPSTITCKLHGDFKQSYDVHKKGHGCSLCHKESVTKLKEDFVKEASLLHNNEFDYVDCDYKGNQVKIKIKCKKHGIFNQTPNSHLSGQKCPKCYAEKKGWTKRDFINFCGDKDAIFYYIRVYNDFESFYKIGITSKTIKERFKSRHELPYEYKTIYEVSSDASTIWDLEQTAKKYVRGFKYLPFIKFDGMHECFKNVDFLTFFNLISIN